MAGSPPTQALGTGDLVADRYRLTSLLGRGGMADVWKATDERLHRDVAVKILRGGPDAPEPEAQALERFGDEARLAARHTHPNIVTVFDAGADDGCAYLVMEALSGDTLRDRLARGPLDDEEIRGLAIDVLAALQVAHDAGVIHRDIKPSNILCDRTGRWKVADFGIAKSVDAEASSDRTLVGQVVGTPRYMAPERLAGRPATVASDLYGVGAVLAEVLDGRDDVDPALAAVAARATAADPAARFTSARTMADAVANPGGEQTVAVAADAPAPMVSAGSGSALAPTVAVAAAGREPVVGWAGPTRAVAAEETATLATPGPPTAVLDRDPASPRRRRPIGLLVVALLLVVGALAAAALAGGGGSGGPAATTGSTEPTTTETPVETTAPTTVAPTTTAPTTTVAPTTIAPAPKAEPAPKSGPKEKGKGKKGAAKG